MPSRPHLTYANVVATVALFLALSGSAALAAGRIQAGDIAPGAVRTSKVFKRAITSGKLAVGAVRSNQIADGAVGARQIANGAVGSQQIATASVAPSNLEFPVFYAASPTGGVAPVPAGGEPVDYPIADASWSQKPGEINVVFGAAVATLAYDDSGAGACRVSFEVRVNGQQVGGGEISSESTSPERLERSVGAQPEIDPLVAKTNQMALRIASNGACAPGSTVDSTRFRVLVFG